MLDNLFKALARLDKLIISLMKNTCPIEILYVP